MGTKPPSARVGAARAVAFRAVASIRRGLDGPRRIHGAGRPSRCSEGFPVSNDHPLMRHKNMFFLGFVIPDLPLWLNRGLFNAVLCHSRDCTKIQTRCRNRHPHTVMASGALDAFPYFRWRDLPLERPPG